MSVHVSSWVWKNRADLSDGLFRLLIALAEWSDDDGISRPSVASMQARCGNVSGRTIQARTAELAALGVIEKITRSDRTGRSTSNEYRVIMDLPKAQPVVGRVKNLAPSEGEESRTLPGVFHDVNLHPEGEDRLHPHYVEPLNEEPTLPPTPAQGGGAKAARASAEDGLQAIRSRAWAEFRQELTRKSERELRRMLRAGRPVAECWEIVREWLDSSPRPATATPAPAWEPKSAGEVAESRLRMAIAVVGGVSEAQCATWLDPLIPVSHRLSFGSMPERLVVAFPTLAGHRWILSGLGHRLRDAGKKLGIEVDLAPLPEGVSPLDVEAAA